MRARLASPKSVSSEPYTLSFSFASAHHFIAIPAGMLALGWAAFSPSTAPRSILNLASYISSVPDRLAVIFVVACVIHAIEAVYIAMTLLSLTRDSTTTTITVRRPVALAWVIQTLVLGYPSIITLRQEVVRIKKRIHENAP